LKATRKRWLGSFVQSPNFSTDKHQRQDPAKKSTGTMLLTCDRHDTLVLVSEEVFNMQHQSNNGSRGFTLVELMVAVVIVGMLTV